MSHRHRLRPLRAFTLIELLVVVAILALLIAILLPSLARARAQAKQVVCASHLSVLGKGMVYYADDNNGQMPNFSWKLGAGADGGDAGAWHWTGALAQYVAIKRTPVGSRDGLLVCPADENPQYRHIRSQIVNGRPQIMPGTESDAQTKAQLDAEGGPGARARGGRGAESSGGAPDLIEPVSYAGPTEILERKVFGGRLMEAPRKLTGIKRAYCFVVLTEARTGHGFGSGARELREFLWPNLVREAQAGEKAVYRRHYGGKNAASNGTNFLFADSHARWHSANYLATKLICCQDFGVPLGFTGTLPTRVMVAHTPGAIRFQNAHCNSTSDGRGGDGGPRNR